MSPDLDFYECILLGRLVPGVQHTGINFCRRKMSKWRKYNNNEPATSIWRISLRIRHYDILATQNDDRKSF